MAESLNLVLDRLLRPAGFERGRSRTAWVRRSGPYRHEVGLRRGKSGADQVAVTFHAMSAADSEGCVFEVSPVAPFKNTYWWPSEPSPQDREQLATQIDRIVLPYFRAVELPLDGAAAVSALMTALRTHRDADPPLQCTGTTLWRQRGQVFDLLDLEPVGGGVFAYVYVSVWHADLTAGIDSPDPEGITRAASITLGPDGADPTPNASIFHLGPPDVGVTVPDPASLLRTALAFFASVETAEDVLARVRPEYREFFHAGG